MGNNNTNTKRKNKISDRLRLFLGIRLEKYFLKLFLS